MSPRRKHTAWLIGLACSLALAGCNRGLSPPQNPGTGEQSSPPAKANHEPEHPAKRDMPACAVELWDGGDFTDDHIIIKGPGDFRDLAHLPDAGSKNWNGEADSLKTGVAATVKTWKHKDFQSHSHTYPPGSEDPDVDVEPSSLKISCP